jgi:hypothetical protein
MKSRLFFWILRHARYAAVSLVAVLAASSCASAGTGAALPTVESLPPTAASGDPVTAPQASLAPTSIVDIQVVPTSRGPNLEATDPATVALSSGQLQLVEFFRFT